MSGRVGVIINPAAGRGRGARVATDVGHAFARVDVHDIWLTTHRGHEAALAHTAIERGFSTIAVVGGDGTWSNVANAIVRSGAAVRFAPIAAGTGNDFIHNAGFDGVPIAALARACVDTRERFVDVGSVDGHYFLNACGFGFDVAVLDRMARTHWLRGMRLSSALYLWCALRELPRYPGFVAALGDAPKFRHLLLAVANGERFGGMFSIAPDATMTDGMLDTVEVWNLRSVRERAGMLFKALQGRHVEMPHNVRVTKSPAVTVSFETAPMCQLDGERRQLTSTAITIRCVPRALRVVVPDIVPAR